MGQEQEPAASTTGTQPADIWNRLAIGSAAVSMTTTTMFTALALHTGQGKPAVVLGASLLLQAGIGLFGLYRMFRPTILRRGAVARAACAPLLLAGALDLAPLQEMAETRPNKTQSASATP